MSSDSIVECGDFLQFQDTLKSMRTIDDKIVYALNTTIPTDSFKNKVDAHNTCKQLYGELQSIRDSRQKAINTCITITSNKVKLLKEEREKNCDDFALLKQLRAEQTKFRLLQVEMGVEEVVKQRTSKVFHERCRGFFNPSDEK